MQNARDIETLAKVSSLSMEYNESVRICRKWKTKNCNAAIDIVLFLEKYARMKAVEETEVVESPRRRTLKIIKCLRHSEQV